MGFDPLRNGRRAMRALQYDFLLDLATMIVRSDDDLQIHCTIHCTTVVSRGIIMVSKLSVLPFETNHGVQEIL